MAISSPYNRDYPQEENQVTISRLLLLFLGYFPAVLSPAQLRYRTVAKGIRKCSFLSTERRPEHEFGLLTRMGQGWQRQKKTENPTLLQCSFQNGFTVSIEHREANCFSLSDTTISQLSPLTKFSCCYFAPVQHLLKSYKPKTSPVVVNSNHPNFSLLLRGIA